MQLGHMRSMLLTYQGREHEGRPLFSLQVGVDQLGLKVVGGAYSRQSEPTCREGSRRADNHLWRLQHTKKPLYQAHAMSSLD